MRKTRNFGITLLILLSIILFLAIIYYSMSFSQNMVIRRTIFLDGHPIEAFTATIPDKPDSEDVDGRICYDIDDPDISKGTESSTPGVCMKENKIGMYYDITTGTN